MANTDVLIAVPDSEASRYYKSLSVHDNLSVQIATNLGDALEIVADRDQRIDVFVVEQRMGDVFALVGELRQNYPRLLIILVDEEADFGMPGQADDISTDPFRNDDLARKITRLMSDRQLETLRSDSLPAVRNIAKRMRTATGAHGKQEAAVATTIEMKYEYVAYYHLERAEPLRMTLRAQGGPGTIQAIAPKQANPDDLMTWVAQNGQSRIAAPEDKPNHPLVARGRLGAVACIPVQFSGRTFGVMVACRDRPSSITQENAMMLELICAQLAAALSKES